MATFIDWGAWTPGDIKNTEARFLLVGFTVEKGKVTGMASPAEAARVAATSTFEYSSEAEWYPARQAWASTQVTRSLGIGPGVDLVRGHFRDELVTYKFDLSTMQEMRGAGFEYHLDEYPQIVFEPHASSPAVRRIEEKAKRGEAIFGEEAEMMLAELRRQQARQAQKEQVARSRGPQAEYERSLDAPLHQ